MITALLSETNPDLIRFPKLNLQFNVKSTAFTVFGASITWYGVLITLGMMLAMIYGFSRMRKFGIDSDRAIDGVIGGVIGAIIGARSYYVLFHLKEYAGDWRSVFNIRQGGLAIYGGVIGALLVGSVICKLRKVRLRPMYDITALGLLIGQCIGRWGNFANHEAFGGNTDGLFGMTSGRISRWIAANCDPAQVDPAFPVHPCFLYESAWCLLGFLLLHFISKKWRKFDGQIFLMYIIWYGAGRFFIEGLRTDSLYLGTIKISQAVALLSVVVGIVLLIIGLSRAKRLGPEMPLYVDTEESRRLLAESDQREAEWQEKHMQKKKNDKADKEEQTNVILAEEENTESDGTLSSENSETEESSRDDADNPQSDEEKKAEKEAKINALLDELESANKTKDNE